MILTRISWLILIFVVWLKAKTEDLVTADSNGNGQWGNNDPSVFEMTIGQGFQGEYQVTNGYGPLKAPKIMKVRFY